jgi:hypothetical protein
MSMRCACEEMRDGSAVVSPARVGGVDDGMKVAGMWHGAPM